ncbi:MAG: HisA/HisF-related TIM barrel protein [Candidatus Dormibacteria bacterium]
MSDTLVIPAIDVRGGAVVRLRQGDYGRETSYPAAPDDLVRTFAAEGVRRVHIVDLDAARGVPDAHSGQAVRRALHAARSSWCEAQVGGGVRTLEDAHNRLEQGATHVVIGSVALQHPDIAIDMCRELRERVLLALDVKDGVTRAEGWTESGDAMDAVLQRWKDWSAGGIVFTNTARDGMLTGPDLDGLECCRRMYPGDVYLSGGVRSADDILMAASRGAAGVIIGRAVLDGTVALRSVLDAVAALP